LLADEAPEYDIKEWAAPPRSGAAEVEGGARPIDERGAPRAFA
jgi:hypothetical protein